MKIILLKDVKGVGKQFEETNVSDGYAMNYLLPKNLALMADKKVAEKIKQLKEQNEKSRTEEIKEINEKLVKRREKHEALEKFRQGQHS